MLGLRHMDNRETAYLSLPRSVFLVLVSAVVWYGGDLLNWLGFENREFDTLPSRSVFSVLLCRSTCSF